MKIKIIDYGYEKLPQRAHYNDAGADVCAKIRENGGSIIVRPHSTAKIPLGFGVELPDGYMANIYPRSGLSSKGIVCELPPIDSGYRGEIFAIVHNGSSDYFIIRNGDRIGQLVILPCILCDFVTNIDGKERGNNGFGSTEIGG